MNFFDKLKIAFFYLLYGKIKGIIKNTKHSDIKINKIKIDNKIYKLFNIFNPIVYSTSIHDFAVIVQKKIIEEASFQYRYNKKKNIFNGNIFKNIVLRKGTPRFRRSINGAVISLICGGAAKNNYFHWMFDVLPKIYIFEKLKLLKKKNIKLLLPALKFNFQLDSLSELNLPKEHFLDGEKFKHFTCNKLYVSDHPYVFNNNPTNSILNIPEWIIKWLRRKFIKIKNKKNYEKIYIDRQDATLSKKRYIINNQEIVNFLTSKNFKCLTLSNISFKEQVKIFQSAKIVVGLHGAGFANIVFCKKGTKIIELQSSTSGNVIQNLAKKCKLNYIKLTAKSKNKKFKKQFGNISININKLKKII